ncbi:DNA recombination protein RmuC [Constrictibacter sp. MBR-5]|uniref:DNA recombination protein RmuC n=1 Tax=Constrictibacter sp. MBR-5 TaxID=3156467 RepID=UPI003393EFFF
MAEGVGRWFEEVAGSLAAETAATQLLVGLVVLLLVAVVWLGLGVRRGRRAEVDLERALRDETAAARAEAARAARDLREEVAATLHRLGGDLRGGVVELTTMQTERLEAVKAAVETRLDALRADNAAKLEAMRATVDEKLHATLEQRLGEKFGLVGQQLERVHKSVGEMQALAAGVGDLKRVLANVKTRGTWGEVALGALLDQAMTADQVGRNVEIRPGSGERVEFAIRLPGDGASGASGAAGAGTAGCVWLPLDSKFPVEDYERLVLATDAGDRAAEEAALRALETRVRRSAQEIGAKYVHPPHSTDFAVMFLPTEGLYAEVLRRPGLADALQRQYRVVPAGPTTLNAILNSLQMGFRTLAIQQRSSEVWRLLAAVKSEFGKYGDVLDKVQQRLRQAERDIDAVRVRERAIGRRLEAVQRLPGEAPAEAAAPVPGEDEAAE